MLFATDKFTLSFGDTAKLTIQYENTTLTNTGKKQAIVEASNDGYTWAQVASIAPDSFLPLKIEALYVRLTTDTTISVVNTNPIPRDTKKSDIAVNINTETLVIKDDLQAYVSKQELKDLVHHPDLSGFVTKAQVQQMIPEIPTPPDITGLASKESVEAKADQTAVDDLKLTIATKADTEHNHNMSDVTGLAEALADKSDAAHTHAWTSITGKPSSFIPSDHTHPTSEITGLDAALSSKADTEHSHTMNDVTGLQEALDGKSPTNHTHTWGSITGKPTTFNPTTHGHGISDITGLQAHLDSKLAKQEAETTYAKKTELPQPVDLSGYATKQSVDNLSQAVNALSGTGDVDLSALATKEELATKANTTHNHTVADINGLQTALDGKAPTSHSHSWNSITSKPTTFTPSTHTHGITDVTGLQDALDAKAPATHSHTVNWADISGKPTVFNPSTHTHTVSWNALTDKPASYPPAAHSHDWNSITGKPTTFVPSSHTHTWSQITGVPSSSTTAQGIVQLNDTLASTAVNQALSAAQGKALNDTKVNRAGDTMTGTLYAANSGVKAASDNDTGIEWVRDGVMRVIADGRERIHIAHGGTSLRTQDGVSLTLQNDKNLVVYDEQNRPIFATNTVLTDIANKVNKAGDTMTGHLAVTYNSDWVGMAVKNPNNQKNGFYDVNIGGVTRGSFQIVHGGNNAYNAIINITSQGDNAERRIAGLTVSATGLHAHAYGHLHEYFVKTRDNQTIDGNKTFSQEVVTTQANGFRIKNSAKNRSIFWRFDGDILYLLKTPNGDPNGNWDDARPLEWNVNTNQLVVRGNADTATRLQTARNIALTGAVTGNVNFDGSANVSISTTLNLAEFTNLKAENGYQRLPNGLIFQWGKLSSDRYLGESARSITFPIAFPTTCLNVQASMYMVRHSALGDGGVFVVDFDRSTANFSLQNIGTNSVGDLRGFYWFAIGY